MSKHWTKPIIAAIGALVSLLLGTTSPALGVEKFCSDPPYFGVIDGNVLSIPPTQITIDRDCTFQNWPQSNPLTTTVNFQTNDPSIYLIIFDNVYFTGHMACASVDHRIWFSNGSDYGSSNACQDLFIPVETIDKRNPAGPATAAIGVPFTYTLTLPSMQLSGEPSLNDLHSLTITDDLTATGADLTYLSHRAYLKGSGTPVALAFTNPDNKHLTFEHDLIPAGEQIVLEITVVPDDTPANAAGTQFSNTAKWWFGRLIDGQFYEPLPGEWGRTLPMTIAAPDLVVTKTSSETALNLGVPATFAIDVQNTGGSDAWNVTILDQLPDGPAAGMCDFNPTTAPGGVTARIFAADGVTPVSGPLVPGTDYSVTFSGAPTCQLSLTTLTPAAVVGPSERLIATYRSQLDGDSTDGITLTNVAGATRWSSSDGSYPTRTTTKTLSDGTPAIIDHEDSQEVTTALAGYYFQKTVANLTSGANPATTAAPGDKLRYRLRLFNVDQTINGIRISDLLDPNSFDLTTFTMVRPPPAGATYSFNAASGLLAIRGDTTPLNVAVGGELVIEFEIVLKTTLTNGTAVDNQANLSAIGITADSDDPYLNGIAPPGEPADPTTVVILSPGPLSKANPQASATIGEQFKYRITVPAAPVAVPLYDVRILDDLGLAAADLRFVSANVVSGGTWSLSNTGSATGLIIEDPATGIDIPASGQAVIEITVELQNITSNRSGLSFSNSAAYTYNRMNGNDATQMAGGAGSTAAMTVVEPRLTAAKVAGNATPGKAAGDPVVGGDLIQYVLTLHNGGNATAYDVNVVDTLPAALTFASGFVPTATINLAPVSGFVATPAGAPGGPLEWGRGNGDDSLDIPAGGDLVLTYRAQVLESAATTFSNLAWVDWTSLDDASAYERTGAGCPATTAPNDYCYGPASAVTTTTDHNRLTKAIVADSYVDAPSTAGDKVVRIGDTATYRLTLNLGEGTTRSVQVQDVLPAGMAYDGLVSITPASGSGPFTYSVVFQPAAGAAGTLAWDLGDVINAPSGNGTPVDALVIEYRAKVLPDAGIAQAPSATLTNTATLSYRDAGGSAVVDPARLVASDTLTLWQPVLAVNKSATPAGGDNSIEAGEAVVYTVDIVNSGAAPAYDPVLVDALPSGLRQGGVSTTSVTLVAAGTALPPLAPAWDAGTGVATWNFDSGTADAYTIPAGETLRVVYRVTADADLGAGLVLTNAATATLYASFDDEAVPAGGNVSQREVYGPTNTATANLTSPTPGALVKENTQPTAAIGEQFKYRITVPATPVNTALHDVRILDDLSASAADLRFVSVAKVSGSGNWTPVNSGSDTSLVIVDPAGGIDIPAGQQVVVEVTVELLNTPTNVVGLSFTNTADYTYNRLADTPASQTSGLPGTTAPMRIVGLIAQKTVAIAVDNNANGLVDPGDELIYTITVRNPGTAPVTGVVLTDDVPANTAYVADSVTLNGLPVGQPDGAVPPLVSGVAIHPDGSISGTIAARSSAVVTFKVRIIAGVPAGTVISNQGYVTSKELPTEPTDADGNAANGYQPTTIVVGSDQQVMIIKEVAVAGGGAALPGSVLEYMVRVTNTGTTPTTQLVISDNLTSLAGQATYVAGSAALNGTPAGVSYAAPVLTADYAATYGNLPPGATATLSFRVLVDGGLAIGTRLTNTAQMAWNTPTLTATASASVDIGGVLGSAMLNGQVWHDANLDHLHGAGETNLAGWTVGLYRNNLQVASATTDADGLYGFSGLEPTLTTAGRYELRFRAAGAGPNTAMLGYAQSPFSNGPQRISGITVASGGNLQGLNLPITPNGAVYDSIRRTSVAGARLAMLNAATNEALPGACFDDPVQQNQVTAADGFYKFDLNFSQPSCQPGAAYLIEVTPPATYAAPSLLIPPKSAATAPFAVPACPGSAEDAVPTSAEYCEVTASAAVPSGPPRTDGTAYHLNLTLSNGLVPGQSQLFNNHIPVDPELDGAVAITKTSSLLNVTKGQLVPYTITVHNVFGVPLFDIGVVDRFPAGFKYVEGSARLDGEPREPRVNGRELMWDGFELLTDAQRSMQLLLVVGAGVSEGEYVNRAQAISTATGGTVSGEATATVRVIPDPTFDCTDVIGKVFDDRNLDGQQDAGEEGLAGVRVVTARGLIATTDEHGRFHITCALVPDEDRGSNFILKLDDRSLPTGYRVTTENPRVQRATRGKMLRFNFGATIHRVVGIDIADGVFEPNSTELRPQWTPKVDELLEELKKGPAVLRLSYLADVEREALVRERLEALKKEIAGEWTRSAGSYRLTVETEVFWRRGGPP